MDTLTMNIRREFFEAIVAGTKRIEYRRTSPFWKRRIEPLATPFRLRLLNGMTHPVPEAVVVVNRVTHDRAGREYRLHLGRLLSLKRWDRRLPEAAPVRKAMTPKDLRDHLKRLSPRGRVTRALERRISGGGMRDVWYENQREHLLGWLSEYDGPGYYGRTNGSRSAEFVYNHLQCAPALLWMAEAAGAPSFALIKAKNAVLAARKNCAAQSAALRRVLPWPLVEALLRARRG